jgi:hypothetical protein
MSEQSAPLSVGRWVKWRLRAAVYAGRLAGVALVGVYVAVPPPDDDGTVALGVAWVAFLVVADAYLFIHQRRMVRPDYLTFSVALIAFVYGGVGTAGWAQFTCLALALVTAVAALSLRAQRDLWAVKRPQPAPPPAELDEVEVAAHAPVSSGIFAPDFRNRRLFVPVGVIVVIAAGLWWRTTSVNHVPHVAGTRQLASGATVPTDTIDPLGHRDPLCVFGERTGLGEQIDQAPQSDVEVIVASVVAHPTGNGPTAPPPQNGEYEVATITLTGQDGAFPYAPALLDFMTDTGKTYTSAEGNSAASGYGPALTAGTVTKGKHVTGTVTFDVPPGGGRVQLRFLGSSFASSACDWLIGT